MIKQINYTDTYLIRQQVMWPDRPIEYIYVEGDDTADHYGYFCSDKLIAVISVFKTEEGYQFRKFATLDDYQGQGIGTMLLSYVMETYKGVIWCNARLEKTDFYKRFGLEETDKCFEKGGKSYIIMKRNDNT